MTYRDKQKEAGTFMEKFLAFLPKLIVAIALSIFGWNLYANAQVQDLVEYTEEGRSESKDIVQAKQDAIQDAIEKVSSKIIREIIGDSKFDRQFSSIKSKIISQSDKYIPFIKTSSSKVDAEQTRMNVTMKVALKNLEILLQKNGFLSATEGPAIVLPILMYSDLVNHKSIRWWVDSPEVLNPFLLNIQKDYIENLKKSFLSMGFHVLDPQTWQYRRQVPNHLQIESLRTQDQQLLAESFKAQLVVKGDIQIENSKLPQTYKIVMKFLILHVGNGRVIADSVRSAETEAGAFASVVPKKLEILNQEMNSDLTSQVSEAWTKGTLTTVPVRLAIRGNFEYRTLENIKEDIKQQIRNVRSISERLFTGNQIELDIDVEGGVEVLAKSLKHMRFRSHPLTVDSVEPSRITLK